MLQSEAGYIDARPRIRQLGESSLATHGRTIHWGHKRTKRHLGALSTLPPKADIERHDWHVRVVAISGLNAAQQTAFLFDPFPVSCQQVKSNRDRTTISLPSQ